MPFPFTELPRARLLVLMLGLLLVAEGTRAQEPLDLSAALRPVSAHGMLADDDWYVWGGSMVEGPDGRYHLFYARWPRDNPRGMRGWLYESEVARAVSEAPGGPYRHIETVLRGRGGQGWDATNAHNPHVRRFGDRYYLYFIVSRDGDDRESDWLDHVFQQQIAVAVADDPAGPWRRHETPVLEVRPDDPVQGYHVNPSVAQQPDGTYLMMFKGRETDEGGAYVHGVATSDAPTGPFRMHPEPLLTDAPAEDPYLWYDAQRARYYAVFKDWHGGYTGPEGGLALITSDDGLSWRAAEHPLVARRVIRWADGRVDSLAHLERPQVWLGADGQPAVLFAAAATESPFETDALPFNVQIPLVPSNASAASEVTSGARRDGSARDTTVRPNIVLFLVDDLGWQDTSVPFHTEETSFNRFYRTPNLERLARQGTLFTNAYAASPVCTPTRTSIMTGRHPARTRITDWTLHPDSERQQRVRDWLSTRSPDWNVRGLQPGDTTLPALLQREGYRTIHVGKAHFGALGTAGADPTNLGFDVNVAGHAAGAPGSYYSEEHYGNDREGPWGVPGLEAYYGTDTYLTAALTREANEAIEGAVEAGEPFFINMAPYAVHAPIMADSQYVGHYAGADPVEAAYASMVEGYDASLGFILEKLEALGVAEETLVVFFSDNGGLSAHARGTTPMGTGQNTHNLPLRSGKGSAYEGGVRVPMLVSWAQPSADAPLQQRMPVATEHRTDAPVVSHDLFATFLEAAGASVPGGYVQDGRSLLPALAGGTDTDGEEAARDTTHFWHYPHLWGPQGPGLEPFTAVRSGPWKLIYYYDGGRYELYHLERDLGETTDLSRMQPTVALRLAEAMRAWMTSVGAQTPVDAATGASLPLPALPASGDDRTE